MIRTLYLSQEGDLRSGLTPMDAAFALQDVKGTLWMDFESTSSDEDEPVLRKTFGFHPLAIDDALQESHVPRIDDWGQYLYIVSHAVILNLQNNRVETLELDIFLGKNYLVTHHDQPIPAIERLWTSIERDARHVKSGADHLLYRLLDELVGSYLPVVEGLDARIGSFEDRIFGPYKPEFLEEIFIIKRAVLQLRRIIDPQREVLNKLARDEYPVIDIQARVYFRDVYDHLVRMHDIIESLRDILGGTLDTYLSLTNNRMNEVMKTLTIITTIFMPISFVVGFFGQNFFAVPIPTPFWTQGPVFYLTMLILILVPVGLYLWIHRRGWM